MMARNRKQARIGYAKGGAVDTQYADVKPDDTVKPGTAAEWTPEAYQASLREQEARGYAGGGAVRQNFRRGGVASLSALEEKVRQGWGLSAEEDDALRTGRQAQAQAQADAGANTVSDPGVVQGTNDPASVRALAGTIGASGYAQGGAVRRIGYADGGTVFEDPSGAPVQPDYSNQVEQRRLADEQVRAETAVRQHAEAERQQTAEARQQAVAEQVQQRAGPQPERPDPQAQPQTSAGAPETPWHRQVYDRLVSSLQAGDATGYNASPRSDVGPGAYGDTAAAPQKGLYADTPLEAHVKDIGAQFQQSWPWVDKLLNHDRAYTPDELDRMAAVHPTKDHSQALQDAFTKAELAGDHDTGARVLQTTQKLYEAARGHAVGAMQAGNLDDGLQAYERGFNQLTNDQKLSIARTTDGRIQWTITPEKAGQGEPVVKYTSPAEARNLIASNGGEVNHVLQNGLSRNIDILQGKDRPLNVPNEGERVGQSGAPYNVPRENVLNTEGGFHPDSPMGLMDRAAQAAKYNRPDREATEYADRARAAVQAGVPADQVHSYLRRGGDQQGTSGATDFSGRAREPGGAAPAVTVGPDGRPVYAQETNIPGATAPTATSLHPSDTTLRSITDKGGPFQTRSATSQGTKRGKDSYEQHSSRDESWIHRDPSYWENPGGHVAQVQPGYSYGERRAGSYAPPANPEDYQPISKVQGPPVPPGFTPPARDVGPFEAVRGGGGMPAPPRNYSREEALGYNARLAEQQNQYRPPTDTAYQARNRQLEQQTGYAAAMDRARAEQPQQIAATNAAERARNAEVQRNRVDIDEYGYKRPAAEIARRQEIADAQARQLELTRAKGEPVVAAAGLRGQSAERAAETRAQGATDVAGLRNQGALDVAGARNRGATDVANIRTQGDLAKTERQQTGLTQRADQRDVFKRENLDFLQSKAANELEQKYATAREKEIMSTVRTKITQGQPLSESETAVHQGLLDLARQQGVPVPGGAPAAAPGGAQAPQIGHIPPQAVADLKADPRLRQQFELKFGPGTAAAVLGRQ